MAHYKDNVDKTRIKQWQNNNEQIKKVSLQFIESNMYLASQYFFQRYPVLSAG